MKSIERINSEIFKTNFKGIGNYRQYPVGEPHIHCCPSVFWHQYTVHTTLLLLLLYCMWSQVPIRVFPLYYYGSSVLLSLMEFQAVNPLVQIVLGWSCFRAEVFPGRSRHRVKVFSGPKYSLGRSTYAPGQSECRAKAVSGPNWAWASKKMPLDFILTQSQLWPCSTWYFNKMQ